MILQLKTTLRNHLAPQLARRLAVAAAVILPFLAGCVEVDSVYAPPPQYRPHPQGPVNYQLTCESRRGGLNYCPLRAEGTAIVYRQISSTPCVPGRTFGTRGGRLWVDGGCRATFEIYPRHYPNPGYGPLPVPVPVPVPGPGHHPRPPMPQSYTIECGSDKGRRRSCRLRGWGHAQVEKRFSKAPCIPGQSFGVSGQTLWVQGGCRAKFRIIPGR